MPLNLPTNNLGGIYFFGVAGNLCRYLEYHKVNEVTKNFVRTTSNLSKLEILLRENSPMVKLNPGEVLARLIYIYAEVSEPLISSMSREFNLEINIILADVEIVSGISSGIVELQPVMYAIKVGIDNGRPFRNDLNIVVIG